MTHPDYQFSLDCGCVDMSASLGIQKMPEPFALLLNNDHSHFFWFNKETGEEGYINWNKWAVYREAKRAANAPETET